MPLMANGVQVDITATNSASPVIKQVAADIGGLETSAKSAGSGVGTANAELDNMGLSLTDLTTILGLATTAAALFVGTYQLGEIGAQNSRLIESGELLAVSYGESMDNIVAKVREASNGTVANMDIIRSANKAMMLGVGGDAEQLANLMEIAAFRGRAMGISTSQAFDDMARGIGRMSPMILDNLGIVVDAESTYGAYAESVGKTSNELTRAEKVQALLTKVIEEGNSQLEAAGGLVEDNATQYEQLEVRVQNYQDTLAITVDNAINPSIEAFLTMADAMDKASEATGLTDQRSRIYLGAMQLEVDKQNELIEASNAATQARWQALASYYDTTTAVNELTGAQTDLVMVDADAVKGAIQVQETYDKYGEKMTDLQTDHADLLAKKQELIDQGWWPESQKIQDVNEKLADNEQKQRDVTTAMQGTLTQMLLNTAAAGLDADAQLALARATGQIDEATYATLTAQGLLKKQYEDGTLTADQYAQKTMDLKTAVDNLQSKDITITVDGIFNEIHNVISGGIGNIGGGSDGNVGTPWATGTDGWMEVPAGYPNDTYPIRLTSGERFAVIPAGVSASPASSAGGGGMGGGGNQFVYAPVYSGVSFGDESEMVNRMYPAFLQMIEMAKAGGHV